MFMEKMDVGTIECCVPTITYGEDWWGEDGGRVEVGVGKATDEDLTRTREAGEWVTVRYFYTPTPPRGLWLQCCSECKI